MSKSWKKTIMAWSQCYQYMCWVTRRIEGSWNPVLICLKLTEGFNIFHSGFYAIFRLWLLYVLNLWDLRYCMELRQFFRYLILGPEILNANFSLSSNYSPFNLLIMQTSLKTNCYILTISLTSLKTNFYTLDNCSLNNYSCNIAPLFLPWSKGIPSRMPCIESITNHGYGYHYALFFICLL